MLPVTNSFGSRQIITQKDVSKVAKGAQESVLLETQDRSLETGACDQIRDTVFFGGRKRETLSQVHGLSWHAAALRLEFEKPIERRNQKLIKIHVDAIYDSQKKLGELHPGKSLEFGTERGLPVIGKESYLILRSETDINPLGIALYEEGEQSEDIPSFKSVTEIESCHIQAIRISARFRCEGRKYKVYFDEINQPIVIRAVVDDDWLMIQSKLTSLYRDHKGQFNLRSSKNFEEMDQILLSTTSTTDLEPIDPGSETGQAMEAEAEAEAETVAETDSVPTFSRFDKIQESDLIRIRISGKLTCQGRSFSVKFDKDSEPILLAESGDIGAKCIQDRLTEYWIRRRAKSAIFDIAGMRKADVSLPLTPILMELADADTGSDVQESTWHSVGNDVMSRFEAIVRSLEKNVNDEKAELIQVFENLIAQQFMKSEHSKILKTATGKIERIAAMQETVNGNVENFKKFYMHLFSLLRASIGSKVMQNIIKKRILELLPNFEMFFQSGRQGDDLRKFNDMLSNQVEFMKNFNTTQVLRCIASRRSDASVINGVTMVTAPKGSRQADLDELLQNPNVPWSEIAKVMKNLQLEPEEPAIPKALQVELGLELNKELQLILVSGAEPKSGKSIYTPETHSRIVSCRSLCNQLLNKEVRLTRQKVDAIKAEFKEHRLHILKETEELNQSAKRLFFRRHTLYEPMINGFRLPMNYVQFSVYKQKVQQTP